MERVVGKPAPADALMARTADALYAVAEMLEAARRAGDGNAIDAAEFALEALLTAAQGLRQPDAAAPQIGGNVVPFRRRG